MSTNRDKCPTCRGFKDARSRQCNPCARRDIPRNIGVRDLAAKAGQVTYSTGKPCKNGHSAERYTSSGHCVQCIRQSAGRPEPTRKMPAKCECCGGATNGNGRLHVDHNHVTGKFRGWLCSNCNTGIGKLGDNIDGIKAALRYLENYD